MQIGMIGGIGVGATEFYYRNFAREMQRRGVEPDVTIVHAHAPTFLKNFKAGDTAAQVEIYCHLSERLKAAGAACVAVTSIGGHFCIDAFKAVSPLPVIDLRTAIADRLRKDGLKRVGILGTNTVMRSALYGHLGGIDVIPPDEARLEDVHQAYIDMSLAGAASAVQRALFFDVGRWMVNEMNAETVLLGGTDLFLAFEGQDCGFPTIDGGLIHVQALADLACADGQ